MDQIVYSSSLENQQIWVWKLNNKGYLNLIQTVNLENQVQPIIVHPNKKYLYAGTKPYGEIFVFSIQLNGKLNYIGKKSLPGNATYISFDQTGKYFFHASYSSSIFTISLIKNNGMISNPYKIIKNIKGCHAIKINFSNNILFVTSLLKDCIYLYTFNSENGELNPFFQKKILTTKRAGPRHITFHKNKKFIYTINELEGTVDFWLFKEELKKIVHKQKINIIPTKFLVKPWSSDIHITPNGKFLYACDRLSNKIVMCKIKKTGYLEILGYKNAELQSRSFHIDNFGKYLIIAGEKSNYIRVYSISESGKLEKIYRYFAGKNPIWVTSYNRI